MPVERSPFEEFVVQRGAALFRLAFLLTRDGALAEDLVQEALAKAHRHWDRVSAADRPEAYVRRIVVNEVVSWRRRRSHREIPSLIPDVADPRPDTTDTLLERDALWRRLGTLPTRQRTVLVLRYYEGLSDAEIADVLDCPPGTVRSLAARAFSTLRSDPHLGPTPAGTTTEEDR